MVSGRHGISKCTAAVTSNLRLGHQEPPLLFLYPTWARGITSHALLNITNDANPILDGSDFGASQAPPLDPFKSRRSNQSPTVTTTKAKTCNSSPHNSSRPTYWRPMARESTHNGNKSSEAFSEESSGRPMASRWVDSSVRSQQKIRRVLGNQQRQAQTEAHDQKTRAETFEESRQLIEAEGASPAAVLATLAQHTVKRTPGSVLRIQVPENTLPGLLFGIENIMQIKYRTGADIDLLEEGDSDGMRTLVCSGSSVAVGTAAAIIMEATPGAISEATRHSTIPPRFSTKHPMARNTTAEPRYVLYNPDRHCTRKPLRADAIPTPDCWTPESLHTYITSLTTMPMPKTLHRIIYRRGEEHQMMVYELLHEVFDNDECLKVLNLTTLNEALSYLTKKSQTPIALGIYNKVQLRGMRLNTETSNIMLRGAAKVKDLDTFALMVTTMVYKGYRPDSGTWIAFLSMLDDPSTLKEVVIAMEERGLLHEAGVQAELCEILAPIQLQAGLDCDPPTSFSGFAQTMESHFSKHWLTLSGANKLLYVLGRRGLISECWLLIRYMDQHGLKPDVVSCNTILGSCCEYSGISIGLDLVERLKRDYYFAPDSVTWAILSNQVWKEEHYATLRVIWRHGCLKGWIDRRMRARVQNSLQKQLRTHCPSQPPPGGIPVPTRSSSTSPLRYVTYPLSFPQANLNSWTYNAGAFVVTNQRAIEVAIAAIQSADAAASVDEADLLAQLASDIVNDDTELLDTWETVSDPMVLLKRALAIDMASATRPAEPFAERMKWLDENTPMIPKQKIRKLFAEDSVRRSAAQKAWLLKKERREFPKEESTVAIKTTQVLPRTGDILRLKELRSRTTEERSLHEAEAEAKAISAAI